MIEPNSTACPLPAGSYTLTSNAPQLFVYCQAQKLDQSWVWTSLELTNLAAPDLANIDGTLQNEGNGSYNGFVPTGSWTKSCKNIYIVFKCLAQKKDQSWVPATFTVPTSGPLSVANIDGVLLNELE